MGKRRGTRGRTAAGKRIDEITAAVSMRPFIMAVSAVANELGIKAFFRALCVEDGEACARCHCWRDVCYTILYALRVFYCSSAPAALSLSSSLSFCLVYIENSSHRRRYLQFPVRAERDHLPSSTCRLLSLLHYTIIYTHIYCSATLERRSCTLRGQTTSRVVRENARAWLMSIFYCVVYRLYRGDRPDCQF